MRIRTDPCISVVYTCQETPHLFLKQEAELARPRSEPNTVTDVGAGCCCTHTHLTDKIYLWPREFVSLPRAWEGFPDAQAAKSEITSHFWSSFAYLNRGARCVQKPWAQANLYGTFQPKELQRTGETRHEGGGTLLAPHEKERQSIKRTN